MEAKAGEKVKSLEKAITILDMIRESDRPLGVNEISRQCGVNLTTAFRMLKTLKCSGWVYQDANDKYIIGPKVSFVTEKNNFFMALKEVAYYSMARLSAQTSQAMNLIVRENERCFILQQSRTEKIVDYVPPIGTVLPIYASAGGKILLSELPGLLREKILNHIDFKPLTKYTITDRDVFLHELDRCKERGYALDERESQEEGFCIAVPVRSDKGEIIAALSFSGIIGRIKDGEISYYLDLLKKASLEISENLFQLQSSV
mgnify:CR=1 FL=1